MKRFPLLPAVFSAILSLAFNTAQAAFPEQIASATTTSVCSKNSKYLEITGTTTITSLGTCGQFPAGVQFNARFTGILTLTHNATSLRSPTGASITTAAGDVADLLWLGSGNWRILNYHRAAGDFGAGTVTISNGGTSSTTASAARTALGLAIGTNVQAYDADLSALAGVTSAADKVPVFTGSGTADVFDVSANAQVFTALTTTIAEFQFLNTQGANVASATSLDLSAVTGNYVHITGTTTVTGIVLANGKVVTCYFDGAVLLTDGVALEIPGGNYTTAAGDIITFRGDAAKRVVQAYALANGKALVETP